MVPFFLGEKMDFIDITVCVLAMLFIAYEIVQLGTTCAQKVWARTVKTLDEIDLIEAAHVPSATNFETIVILVAATLRDFFMLPVRFYTELTLKGWEKTPEIRLIHAHLNMGSDILGAMATMMSGYPERAEILFFKEHISRMRSKLEAEQQDYEMLHGSQSETFA